MSETPSDKYPYVTVKASCPWCHKPQVVNMIWVHRGDLTSMTVSHSGTAHRCEPRIFGDNT